MNEKYLLISGRQSAGKTELLIAYAGNILKYAKVKITLPFKVNYKNPMFACSNKRSAIHAASNKKDEILAKKISNHMHEALRNWKKNSLSPKSNL